MKHEMNCLGQAQATRSLLRIAHLGEKRISCIRGFSSTMKQKGLISQEKANFVARNETSGGKKVETL
jgi:hypothetical protein